CPGPVLHQQGRRGQDRHGRRQVHRSGHEVKQTHAKPQRRKEDSTSLQLCGFAALRETLHPRISRETTDSTTAATIIQIANRKVSALLRRAKRRSTVRWSLCSTATCN